LGSGGIEFTFGLSISADQGFRLDRKERNGGDVLVGAQSRKLEGVKYGYREGNRREWWFRLWKVEM
jgi:hypothetical protein